ncbi:hypothetical protein FKR81_36045 [Lentzea tibetensis]|uniref:Excreted virulence factor EspC, type VII ESX diderm n=1 Tax=Lentzea tibetensis TaxID=2591470 RepID=A0A563EJT9_9PSEU|nr:hypothetical protein [Lentzea tibetensis]TWP46353.1 hypothetical protein FKR81_36045 [Lentzea tibetensis]
MTFGVNAQEIMTCGKEVSGLADQAEKIKAAAESAIVPEQSWGLLGQALTYSDYVELTTAFMDHMDKMIEKMGEVGDKLSLSGEHYLNVDDAMKTALDQIGDRLSSAAAPPRVSG